jgi:hypothetical protein
MEFRKLGWVRDKYDSRDHVYQLGFGKLEMAKALPASVDLRSLCPPVYDQGDLGSCSSNETY